MYVKELVDCYEKAAADARRTESDAMAKKARQQKKANKKLQGGKVSNFGYAPSRLAKEKCPCCGHGYLQKLLTDAQLKNANKQRKKKHSKRMSAYEKKPASKKNEQNKPRLRLQSMEFKCPCLWLKGSKCPECNGLNIDSCEICNCTCQTGPIEWKDFESVSRGAQSRARGLEENTAPRTVADNAQSFVNMITNSLQLGQRDLRANNVPETTNNIAGAGAAYLSRAEITDDLRHFAAEQMGLPTTSIGDNIHITELQRGRQDYRYYNNGLSRISTAAAASTVAASTAAAAPREGIIETTPPPMSQQNQRSTRSSTSTFAERSEASIARVFSHVKDKGEALQEDGSPTTRKRKAKLARTLLSDPDNNAIKMRVISEAVHNTPELGFSQKMAYDVMNCSDLDDSDMDDIYRGQKKKKKKDIKKKKKKKKNL